MVAGEVRAPYVPLGNERIDRRHAHSVALAAFFRDQKELTGETWSTAGEFFLGIAGAGRAGVAVPVAGARGDHGVAAAGAAGGRAAADRRRDRRVGGGAVRSARGRAGGARRGRRRVRGAAPAGHRRPEGASRPAVRADDQHADHGRPLIGLLANRNVLPKYGFPTDTVELRTDVLGRPGRPEAGAVPGPVRGDLRVRARRRGGGGREAVDLRRRVPAAGPGADRELLRGVHGVLAVPGEPRRRPGSRVPVLRNCRRQGAPAKLLDAASSGSWRRARCGSPGMVAPQRSWHGATYVLSRGAEEFE